jgi:hypothetical protein
MSLTLEDYNEKWDQITQGLKEAEDSVRPFLELVQNNPHALRDGYDPLQAARIHGLVAQYMTTLEYSKLLPGPLHAPYRCISFLVKLQLTRTEPSIAEHKIQIEVNRVEEHLQKLRDAGFKPSPTASKGLKQIITEYGLDESLTESKDE